MQENYEDLSALNNNRSMLLSKKLNNRSIVNNTLIGYYLLKSYVLLDSVASV
jgi:hypothetical protein